MPEYCAKLSSVLARVSPV